MMPRGAFLCFGKEHAPEVHTLGYQALSFYWQRIANRSDKGRKQANRLTFGKPFDYAIPAWSDGALSGLLDYQGPWQTEVKGIAACILTGQPFGGDSRDGGSHDRLTPEPDDRPPAGDSVPLFSELSQ